MSYSKAAALLERGPSRPTLFTVRLPSRTVSGFTNQYLDFYCTTTAIPEIRHNSVKVAGHENMGVVRDQPTAIIYAKPFTITVIADPDFQVYQELRQWFDRTAVNANQQAGFAGRTQKMRYYNTYTEDMQLIKLEQSWLSLKETMRIKFINAYPIAIGQVALDTETTNTVTKFQVQFTYESYNIDYNQLGSVPIPWFGI